MAQDNLPIAQANTMAIRSLHDFQFKPSIMDKLYRTYGQGFMIVDMMRKAAGRSTVVSNETMTAEEELYPHRTITLAQNSSGGATPGAYGEIVLDADDLDSNDNYYPREGFTVITGDVVNGFVVSRITSITVSGGGSTVTLRIDPFDSTKTIGTIAQGTEIAIGASAFAAETGQPDATSVGTVEREFYAQIMKETIKFGGMELAKQKWVYYEGIGWFNHELARAEFLLDMQEEMALIMGQPNTNSLVQASSISGENNTIYANKGIYTWIDELGGEVNYVGASGFAITDFDTAAEYLESQGITNDIVLVGCGGSLLRRIENSAVSYVQGSGDLNEDFTMVDNAIFNGQPNMTLNIGFKAIKKSNILFLLTKLPIFSNPYLLGISGYMLEDAGIMVPLTKVKDRKTGFIVPNLSARYVGLGNYSRKRVVATLGGMDGFAKQHFGYPVVSEVDGNNTYWLSHGMFPFLEANKALLIKRSS